MRLDFKEGIVMDMDGEGDPVVIDWDYKTTPPWVKITEAAQKFYRPCLLPVDDTHDDSEAILVSGNPMSPEAIQLFYNKKMGYCET